MVANRIWILLGKKVSGEATPQELEELQSLIAGSEEGFDAIGGLEQMLHTVNVDTVGKSEEEIDARWQRFKKNLITEVKVVDLPSAKRRGMLWFAAASVFVICFVCMALFMRRSIDSANALLAQVETPAKATRQLTLPDGTKVWLNAKSNLIYDKKKFGVKLREVSLVGEAFFDVKKDKKHPFVVNTASLSLRVLGTAFNVRAFSNEKKSEAALVHGSIEVTLINHPDKKIILKPSEKIIVRNNTEEKSLDKVSARERMMSIPLITLSNIHYKDEDPLPVEAQWIEKKLAFESETFDDIAARMERYYNVNISFEDESLRSLVFSGTFTNETVSDAFKYFQLTSTTQFKFRTEDNKRITIFK
ncbi:FecR family protein [Mucilaginibacter auburnensis]|uniref:Ferric-dicitrate binding protein FerR (Iron transport regulator) n=1 Tax=Mucilaginibacter auburnensis TaxID=1457233 RepID=A0A2H9VSF2_9SPHI|nr:FecR domain-containing protein [Mucilaginibacter auburnensis]PJJ83722.1 ferric-dicitrate binding protein FerR (iron transport regulator) [Mucilaginibacter auburnensis]